MNLGEIFTTDQWAEFNSLPLPIQEWKAKYYLKMHRLHMNQFEKNKKNLVKKGRPKKWADDELEDISMQISEIMKSQEYKNRKDPREKDITAYVIWAEQFFDGSNYDETFPDDGLKKPSSALRNKEIRKLAKSVKERVDKYKIRCQTGT